MLCVPDERLAVLQIAVLLLPLPVRPTATQPEMDVPPSLKLTVPFGLLPDTVAVKVTVLPSVAGFGELASAVDVLAKVVVARVTASMKVDLSPLASVPANMIVCEPAFATENDMLKVVNPVFGGDTKLPIWMPSTLSLIGCT